ncbi:MAG: enoyl-CoA hydratase [Rhodospirillaceae bacterium]|nr:enoyl-CoA hydratase [Rhodospirillaceae bacterium]MBT5666631.1 enoyl-CoA hydratase [Rhodospirillaceae bacterium]
MVTTDKMIAERDGAIGRMIFNNPARHNAVSPDMWAAVGTIMDDLNSDDEIRVVIVSGAGGKAFVSGADISKFEDERANAEAEAKYHVLNRQSRAKLTNSPKPTIAMIQGYCIGGGVGTAIACDMRICSDNARFAIPAARLGVGYYYDDLKRLTDLIGPSFTKEIFFTARQFDAEEARDMGLVDRVVPDAELEEYVATYAATIAANAPMTIQAVKKAVLEGAKDPDDRDVALCDRMVDICNASEDYSEGRRAFMEKRKPVFVGR